MFLLDMPAVRKSNLRIPLYSTSCVTRNLFRNQRRYEYRTTTFARTKQMLQSNIISSATFITALVLNHGDTESRSFILLFSVSPCLRG
jgi:hypothetical protein